MTFCINVPTEIGAVTLPRLRDDNGEPLPPCVHAVQIWGQPPPFDTAAVPISLPYYQSGDVARLLPRIERLIPRWKLEVRDVFVAAAITHEDALALFRRWGW